MTEEELETLKRQVKESRLMRDKLMYLHIPIRVASAITQHGKSELKYAIVSDFDQWSADVLAGKYDEELSAIRNIGPRGISQLKDNLRKNKPGARFPEPEDHIAPPQPAPPSPASKAGATVKPNGVSYSIHVDNANYAGTLTYLSAVLSGTEVFDEEAGALAHILNYFIDSEWHISPQQRDLLIRNLERLIRTISK